MKRKLNKRSAALLVCLAVILTATVGGTLSYIFTHSDVLNNIFTPAHVSCAVVENGSEEEHTTDIVNVDSKTDVMIKNTGNTNAYIRVAVIVTWKSADGTRVWGEKPVEHNDYTIDWAYDDEQSPTNWTLGPDGFYYYNESVAPDRCTGILINKAMLNENVVSPIGTDGTEYYLSIEIIASAIQAEGMGATFAQDAWAKAKGSN